jgi:hypothetical protein
MVITLLDEKTKLVKTLVLSYQVGIGEGAVPDIPIMETSTKKLSE